LAGVAFLLERRPHGADRLPRIARAICSQRAAAPCPSSGGSGFRLRQVVGPLPPLERETGAIRLRLVVSSSLARHADWIGALAELGVDEVHLHQVGRNQEQFIETFGQKVLPQLR
jgi:hypothetical protein